MLQGIGRGFVKKYLGRPHTIVVGTVRDPSSTEARELFAFPKADGSNLFLIKLNGESETDALAGVRSLTTRSGIEKLDVVIANSGIFKAAAHQKISQMKTEDLMEHLNINTVSVVRLFQATLPLQEKAPNPIFLVNSAGAGTLAGMEDFAHFPLNSYAVSKAAANFLTRRIHFENPHLIAFAVHPGYGEVSFPLRIDAPSCQRTVLTSPYSSVVTETRTAVARALGAPEEGISIEECVDNLVTLVRARLTLPYGT